jgi:starvation-inducible outer membrane lipoprotein
MKKLAILLLLCGCVSTPAINQTDLSKVDFEKLLNQKRSESCQSYIFGILPVSTEASIADAAWKAEIKHGSYVEYSTLFIPLIIAEKCVIVYGE